MKRFKNVLLYCLFSALVSLNCAGSLGVNLFPDSKDVELGKQVDEEIRKNPKEYPILKNRPDVKEYVERMGKQILASPEITKRGIYAYTFEIIHDDSTINAFCTPGGYIYVYTGLLKFVDNEATLAGVLGHEIGHAERRHATRRMTSALGVQILLGVVLGQNPNQAAEIAGNLFGGLALLKNSRDDEIESDTYSMKYLRSTEYYPGGIRYFFEKISAGRKGGSFERLLSTHPLPQDRIENVEKLLKEWNISERDDAKIFEARYQEFKRKLP
ncbi:MAG: M48 family metallopeptidase [Ignavibacteriae bacterium]|nr:M48 family metallopeptidase [Ignavibacteriota bacterium]